MPHWLPPAPHDKSFSWGQRFLIFKGWSWRFPKHIWKTINKAPGLSSCAAKRSPTSAHTAGAIIRRRYRQKTTWSLRQDDAPMAIRLPCEAWGQKRIPLIPLKPIRVNRAEIRGFDPSRSLISRVESPPYRGKPPYFATWDFSRREVLLREIAASLVPLSALQIHLRTRLTRRLKWRLLRSDAHTRTPAVTYSCRLRFLSYRLP